MLRYTGAMVDERQLTKDSKVAMYWRIAAMMVFLIIAIAVYYFVLPVFFPQLTRQNVVDPQVLLRAYYHTDDPEERRKVFRRYMRYSTEQNTDMALKELESADEEHRIRAMHLLIRSNVDKCYKPLIKIYHDTTRSDRERWKAISVIMVIGRIEDADRAMVFKKLNTYTETQLEYIAHECEKGLSEVDKQQLTELLLVGDVKQCYWTTDIVSMAAIDDDAFIELFLLYAEDSHSYGHSAQRLLQFAQNDVATLIKLINKHPKQLQSIISRILERVIDDLSIEERMLMFKDYDVLTRRCVDELMDYFKVNNHYSQETAEVARKMFENGFFNESRNSKNIYVLLSIGRQPFYQELPREIWEKGNNFEKSGYISSILQSQNSKHIELIKGYASEKITRGSKKKYGFPYYKKVMLAQRKIPMDSITELFTSDIKRLCGKTEDLSHIYTYMARLPSESKDRVRAEKFMVNSLLIKGPRVTNSEWVRKCAFLNDWYANEADLLRLLFLVYHESGYEYYKDMKTHVKILKASIDWHGRMEYVIKELNKTSAGTKILQTLVVHLTQTEGYVVKTHYGDRDLKQERMFKALIESAAITNSNGQ